MPLIGSRREGPPRPDRKRRGSIRQLETPIDPGGNRLQECWGRRNRILRDRVIPLIPHPPAVRSSGILAPVATRCVSKTTSSFSTTRKNRMVGSPRPGQICLPCRPAGSIRMRSKIRESGCSYASRRTEANLALAVPGAGSRDSRCQMLRRTAAGAIPDAARPDRRGPHERSAGRFHRTRREPSGPG